MNRHRKLINEIGRVPQAGNRCAERTLRAMRLLSWIVLVGVQKTAIKCDNLSMMHLPLSSPKLNSIKQVLPCLRDHGLANFAFKDYEYISCSGRRGVAILGHHRKVDTLFVTTPYNARYIFYLNSKNILRRLFWIVKKSKQFFTNCQGCLFCQEVSTLQAFPLYIYSMFSPYIQHIIITLNKSLGSPQN